MNEIGEMELNLFEIFELLKKRLLMIFSLIIIAIFLVVGYTIWSYTPMYTTSTSIVVSRQDINLGISSSRDYSLQEDLILTFKEIINSETLRACVMNDLNTDDLGIVDVSDNKSSIIRISVTHTDPEMAAAVANKITEVFREMIKEMMYDIDSSVLDEAIIPLEPHEINLVIKVAIAIVLGGIIGVCLCFVSEFSNKTFKKPEQFIRLIDIPVIGVIPDLNEKYFLK